MFHFNQKITLLSLCFVLFQYSGFVYALECKSGTEPVLKVVYEVEDHVVCMDPSLVGLSSSSTRGIDESVLYQTKVARKRIDTGKCVAPVKFNGKRMDYRNLDYHMEKIVQGNRTYLVNMTEKNGSIRYTVNDDVYEVGTGSYTLKEFSEFEKMEILPGYTCGVLPPLPGDPNNMKICVTDIDEMKVILYKEFKSYFSDHINTYKATSIDWTCENSSLFDAPSGVDLVKHY
jgi:hypothetical protein